MNRFATAFLAGVAMSFALSAVAEAKDKTIAVSWKIFQEERWKTDEAAIKAVVEAAGDKYVSVDAQGSAAKQATDIEGLVTQKVDVIMVVAYDSDAILPSCAFQTTGFSPPRSFFPTKTKKEALDAPPSIVLLAGRIPLSNPRARLTFERDGRPWEPWEPWRP